MHYARMSGHDYHEGYYFVTINTAPRRNCLSRIVGGKVALLPFGEIVLKGYKPHGVAVKRLAESTTLVLSGFPESVPSTPINYGNCHLNNDWARAIAVGQSGDESPDSQPRDA